MFSHRLRTLLAFFIVPIAATQAAPADFGKGISATNPSGTTLELRHTGTNPVISATDPTAVASITNLYAKNISATTANLASLLVNGVSVTGGGGSPSWYALQNVPAQVQAVSNSGGLNLSSLGITGVVTASTLSGTYHYGQYASFTTALVGGNLSVTTINGQTPTFGGITGTGTVSRVALWGGTTSQTSDPSLTYSGGQLTVAGNFTSGSMVLGQINQSGRLYFARGSDGALTTWSIGGYSATEATDMRIVNGAGNGSIFIATNNSTNTADRFRFTGAGNLITAGTAIFNTTVTGAGATASSTLHVLGTGRITSWTAIGANVTPSVALDVFGTVSSTSSRITQASGCTTADNTNCGLHISNPNGSNEVTMGISTGNTSYIHAPANGQFKIVMGSQGFMVLDQNNQSPTRMALGGDFAPSSTLHVSGTVRVTNDLTVGGNISGQVSGLTVLGQVSTSGNLLVAGTSTTVFAGQLAVGENPATFTTGNAALRSKQLANGCDPASTAFNACGLLIQNFQASTSLVLGIEDGTNGYAVFRIPSGGGYKFYYSQTEYVRLDINRNWFRADAYFGGGGGVNTPSATVHVSGSILIRTPSPVVECASTSDVGKLMNSATSLTIAYCQAPGVIRRFMLDATPISPSAL